MRLGYQLENNPYQRLANEIILQAVRDYRHALRVLSRAPESLLANQEREDCLRFFFSGWFALLSEVDPVYLIEELEKEVR